MCLGLFFERFGLPVVIAVVSRARVAALMFGSLTFLAAVTAYGALKAAPTERNFVDIDQMMNKAVSDGNIPGGVVLIGHHGQVVYRKAFGARALEPVNEPMTVDTIFDLASLTKCIATTTSMMKLIQEGPRPIE